MKNKIKVTEQLVREANGRLNLAMINLFLPYVSFWSPWKQENFGLNLFCQDVYKIQVLYLSTYSRIE